MTTIATSHSGKSVFQNSAIEIAINDPFDIRTKETVLSLEPIFIDHLEYFKVIFHALAPSILGRNGRLLGRLATGGMSIVARTVTMQSSLLSRGMVRGKSLTSN